MTRKPIITKMSDVKPSETISQTEYAYRRGCLHAVSVLKAKLNHGWPNKDQEEFMDILQDVLAGYLGDNKPHYAVMDDAIHDTCIIYAQRLLDMLDQAEGNQQ